MTVDAAPHLPVLIAASLDRDAIRSGETVTLRAEFDGFGWWESVTWGHFGTLQSGVPATSPPLTSDQTLRVVVVNGIGEQVEARFRVTVL